MDPDLIISTSKDNRTLLWDVSLSGPIGDLCQSRNWTFDAKWCPRNPDMIAVSSFDGTVSVHSLQAQGILPFEYESNATPEIAKVKPDPNDIFSMIGRKQSVAVLDPIGGLILERPPKWLRRPNGVSWAFGGKLVSFSEKTSTIRVPSIDSTIMSRVDMLNGIVQSDDPEQFKNFCDIMSNSESDSFNDQDLETWAFLKVMFEKSREHMHEFLGLNTESEITQRLSKIEQKLEALRLKESNTLPSESMSFPLYVAEKGEESEIDNVITRLCIVGQFDKAVDVCVSSDRWADALVIAVSGGPDLLKRTQKEYFNRRKKEKTYIRLLEAVVDSNFEDIVQNVKFDVTRNEWKDLLGFISTFASSDELSRQFSLLGLRLSEEVESPGRESPSADVRGKRKFYYHAAALSFIGAGDLENAVRLWIRRENEEESNLLRKENAPSRLVNHFVALQSLIEKTTILRKAVNYFDPAITQPADQADVYSLQALYDRILEYSEILSVLGRPEFAWKNLQLVPHALKSQGLAEGDIDPIAAMRDRLYHSLGVLDKNVPTSPFNVTQIISQEETAEIEAKASSRVSNVQKSSSQLHGSQYQNQTGSYPVAGYQNPAYPQFPQSQNTPYYAPYAQTASYAGGVNNQYNPPPVAPYLVPEARPSVPGIFTPQPISTAPSVVNPPPATTLNNRPRAPPAVSQPIAPPVFTPPPIRLPRTNSSFPEAGPGRPFNQGLTSTVPGSPVMSGPPMNQRPPVNQGPPVMAPPLMNQRPPVNQGPTVMAPPLMNQRPPVNQGPTVMAPPLMNQRPPLNQGPPVMAPPLMNQRPPVNQGPPVMSGPPMNQRPPVNQGPPVMSGPPMNQRPPVNQGPPAMSGPPMNQRPPVNQGPPVMAPPINQRPPVNQGPPVMAPPMNQRPPVNQGSSMMSGPPMNLRQPMNQGPPIMPGPPINQGPPVINQGLKVNSAAPVANQMPPVMNQGPGFPSMTNESPQLTSGAPIKQVSPLNAGLSSMNQRPPASHGMPMNHARPVSQGSPGNVGSPPNQVNAFNQRSSIGSEPQAQSPVMLTQQPQGIFT
jgi:protein transport protein SEC31